MDYEEHLKQHEALQSAATSRRKAAQNIVIEILRIICQQKPQ